MRAKRPRLQELIGIVAKWMMGEKNQEESEKTNSLSLGNCNWEGMCIACVGFKTKMSSELKKDF